MATENKSAAQPVLKYRRVQVSTLNRRRHGKHYDLVKRICEELQLLPPGAALEIPLSGVDGIGLAKLRSAIHRGAASKDLAIETLADKENLYVWGRSASE